MSWVWLSVSIICELIATLSLRASEGFKRKIWMLPIAIGYSLAFCFLALALATGMPVAVAYGVWSAAGIALIALLARAIWKDPLTKKMIFGLILIAVGIMLIEFG